jgi:hypothetical protein
MAINWFNRHSRDFLLRKIEQDAELLLLRLQVSEEKNFELLHCLIFNLLGTTLMPDRAFNSEEERSVWERNISVFLRGISLPLN